jgi:hypothetical protein
MAADHRPCPPSAYASTTARGAGANTWPRTACQAAAALNVMESAKESNTPATTHCHTHSATTGSRSGHRALAISRGVRTAASAPSSSSARETNMTSAYEGRGTHGYGCARQVTHTTVCPAGCLTK